MIGMRVALLMLVAMLACGTEPPGDALAIMKKMAATTEVAAEARRQFVYHQHVRASLLKGSSDVLCRESRDYDVIPQPKTTEKKLVAFSGACLEGKKMAPYSVPEGTGPCLRQKGTSGNGDPSAGERESVASVIDDLVNDPKSRDGFPRKIFPLTSGELDSYRFSLKGDSAVNGRRAHNIHFEPVYRNICIDENAQTCRPWKGDVAVDAEDFQPVRIDTQLAKGVPWGARVFMGINIGQLGFSAVFRRVAPGVWFPATYGTEFYVKVFWIKRTITMSMENTDFRKTDAQSTVEFDSREK
jgi:hypothetical protein